MIITIASASSDTTDSLLAANLAALFTQVRHKVLLVDATPQQYVVGWSTRRRAIGNPPIVPARRIAGKSMQPELENLALHFDDILIDTESRDCMASRSALVMAHVVVAVVHPDLDGAHGREALIKRLETARLFNPGLRIVVVPVCSVQESCSQAREIARAFAARLSGARLTDEMLRENAAMHQAFGAGLSIVEGSVDDDSSLTSLKRIFAEIVGDTGASHTPIWNLSRTLLGRVRAN